MRCPFCGHMEDKVVDSRTVHEGMAIRRRRECLSCNRRYTTYEYIENQSYYVIKADKTREPYSRDKLRNGIELATNKRPVSAKDIDELVYNIEGDLFGMGTNEVTSETIGEMVMRRLRDLDEVAYVRFASVYRKFKDKTEFFEELKNLIDEREK